MSAESLKEKMRDFANGSAKSVRITGADLAGESAGPDRRGESAGAGGTTGTVEADVPKEAKTDVFTEADATSEMHRDMTPSFIDEKIDISEDDRAAFLQAIVTGGRYEREFSLFGGKLRGVFRCRKVQESDGIIAWLSHLVNAKRLDARIEYMTMMRNAILAAQVKSLRGLVNEDFPELVAPYGPARSPDGKEVVEPGWLGVARSWGERPEALVTAIHMELQKFEKRYWAMVMDSGNQNFWNPAPSI